MLDQQPQTNNSSPPIALLSKFRVMVPTAIKEIYKQQTVREIGSNYQPSDVDIFCGRGKGFYNRPGNKKFRELLSSYIPVYLAAKSKVDKSAVLNTIVDKVRSIKDSSTGRPAQFIKFTKKTGWVEIGDDQAREKVGHAMREAIASIREDGDCHTSRETSHKKPRVSKAPPTPLTVHSISDLPEQTIPANDCIVEFDVEPLFWKPTQASSSSRSSFTRDSLSSDMMRAAIESFIGL